MGSMELRLLGFLETDVKGILGLKVDGLGLPGQDPDGFLSKGR